MKNPIRKLAGETAIYGLSSILGRILNYLLVIVHTRVFLPEAYGIVTELYSYVAIIMVIFTFGMETTFFRFTTRDKDPDIYGVAATFIFLVSLLGAGTIYLNAENLEAGLNIPNSSSYIQMLAVILFLDSFISIPFAKLRIENKPWKFAIAKLVMILLTVGLNIYFLVIMPTAEYAGNTFFSANKSVDVGFIFLANLIGSASVYLFLFKEIFQIRFKLVPKKLTPMLLYAIPILLTGVAGMLNENLDKVLFRQLFPEALFAGTSSEDALGIYGAAFKLSVFMMLGIQAFRYAAEPFFFNRSEEKDSPALFAKVFHYFVLVCLIVFVGVSLNVKLIGEIFLKQPEYWEALYIVPVLLMAKLMFGAYVNMSIWFKITDKTIFGTWFSLAGVVATVTFNFLLVPVISYMGAAFASLICYLTMASLCYVYGQKYYPIPYRFGILFVHLLISIILVLIMFFLEVSVWLNLGVSILYAAGLGTIILRKGTT